ncbi:proteasome assembly chaperone 3-like isoform X2 [Corticium candelabrum]|uniref:proteasome assembly chaperone 3-like isoform X2 n=1 Tax=Corticium candelabrum TaxID=121492 RepID=UPI002E2595B6|nr:proteasome assembly chaperone 3-like isoform X2 [Corticium candelabrum]
MRRLMSDDGGLKLPTKQAAFLVNGIATEILLTHFGDRIFIAVTQLQKLGTIIHAASDKPVEIEGHPTFTVKILLGKDEASSVFVIIFAVLVTTQSALAVWLARLTGFYRNDWNLF